MPKAPRQLVTAQASSDAVMQTLAWLRRSGFKPVPLHKQSKAAISRQYVSPDYKPPDDELWRRHDYGVGMLTGPAASGPVDADLDCVEAVWFAARLMPPTTAVFGRKSKLRSHMLYRSESSSFEKTAFLDPADNSTILELRGDGGHQTCAPGSLHEATGELIEWSDLAFPEVPVVAPELLQRAARKVALATLIVRHVWLPGYHNEPCKHLTGLLFYLEWPVDEVIELIQAVMDYTDDRDKSRIPTVRATYKRGEAGKKISGAGVLRKQLKDDVLVDRLLEWAGSPTINLLTEYNERFAIVSMKGKFRIVDTDVPPGETPVFYQKDDWINLVGTDYSGQVTDKGAPIAKSKLWLANPRRRTYLGADFLPGLEEADKTLNLWTGWAVKPVEGCCDAWLELLEETICGGDQDLFNWLLHWFANIVREPRSKSLTAPVIVGVEGAGKSLLLGYFGRILGPAFVVVTNDEHIWGKFNQHLSHCLLLHSDEALYAGDKKHAGIIRSLITDEFRMFEPKGVDAQQVRNYIRLILTSNDLHAAPAKPGDRRYTVVDMDKRKASDDLVKRVVAERDGGGPEALFHYLLEMDYDPAVPRVNVKNESLLGLKEVNMQPVEAWWYDALQTGCVLPDWLAWASFPEKDDWPPVVSSSALHVAAQTYLRQQGVRSALSNAMLAQQINRFTGHLLYREQRRFVNPLLDNSPPAALQLSERQNAIANMPPLDECRVAFERYLGQDITWPKTAAKQGRIDDDDERY